MLKFVYVRVNLKTVLRVLDTSVYCVTEKCVHVRVFQKGKNTRLNDFRNFTRCDNYRQQRGPRYGVLIFDLLENLKSKNAVTLFVN